MNPGLVTVLLYHNISPISNAADHFTQYHLIKLLNDKKLLHRVICLSAADELDIPREKIITVGSKLPFMVLSKVLNLLSKVYGSLNQRYLEEVVFDILCWKYIDPKQVKLIYCSKPLFTYTLKKCRKFNIKTVLRASVAHPLYNYYLVKNEELQHNLKGGGVYTDLQRCHRLVKSLHLSDFILINQIGRRKEFLYTTYASCFKKNKLIPYKTMFIAPKYPGVVIKNKSTPDSITFIHVSFMSLIKGTYYLLEAWKRFQEQPNNAQLLLIGGFDQQLSKMYPPSQIEKIPNVQLLGYKKDPFLKYCDATAFVCSSMSESGPATIIEAMSLGIPAITSRSCGLSNLIEDEHNGFTYDFNDIDRLTNVFHWFANNTHVISSLRVNAQATASKFSLDYFKQEMSPIFDQLVTE